jgi:hypothetical protein
MRSSTGGNVVMVIAFAFFFAPLITWGIAMCTCVSRRRAEGKTPNKDAWTICCSVFWLVCVLGGFFTGPLGWIGGSFCMVIPFCCPKYCAWS